MFSVVGALLLGLTCHTCRHSRTRSLLIVSALLLFSAIATITVLMVRHVRGVSPSLDVTVGVIMIAILFIVWLILIAAFYIAISGSKSNGSKVSSNGKLNDHHFALESVIPNPPRIPAPSLENTHRTYYKYDIRTKDSSFFKK